MTEKRFIEFLTQNSDDGELNTGFVDISSGKYYHTKDRANARDVVYLLNAQHEEIEQLKSELAEIKRQEQEVIEYLRAYHKGDVNELKKELKE